MKGKYKANILREYINTIETKATIGGKPSTELQEWIVWARNKIAWFDPLINQVDPLLDDNYRKVIYSELHNDLKLK